MIHWEIKNVCQGYKVRLVQKDESGLIIQFLESGGTFKTKESAQIAFAGIAKEFSEIYKRGTKCQSES